MLPSEYLKLTAATLRQLANYHERMAAACKTQAAYADMQAGPPLIQKPSLRTIRDKLSHELINGKFPDEAAIKVAEELKIPQSQANANVNLIIKRNNFLIKVDRAATIRTLYRAGYDTKKIAELLNIHPTNVRKHQQKTEIPKHKLVKKNKEDEP